MIVHVEGVEQYPGQRFVENKGGLKSRKPKMPSYIRDVWYTHVNAINIVYLNLYDAYLVHDTSLIVVADPFIPLHQVRHLL